MSRIIDGALAGIAGAGALVAAASSQVVDYNYPPDFTGVAAIIMAGVAMLGALGIFITQMVGLSRQKITHDLVNSMATATKVETEIAFDDKLREAKKAAFAEGKVAGGLEERAARAPPPAAQMPQIPVPKE